MILTSTNYKNIMKHCSYFPHDSNAKDDPKITLLIDDLNPEGYGIFFILIEILRDQPDFRCPIKLIPSIARKYNTSIEKIKSVITKYELFEVENDFFYSNSLINRMNEIASNKLKLSNAGKKGMLQRWQKKNSFDYDSIIQYFIDNNQSKEFAEKFIKHYEATQWKDKKGNQITDWQSLANFWFQNEKKQLKSNRQIVKSEIDTKGNKIDFVLENNKFYEYINNQLIREIRG